MSPIRAWNGSSWIQPRFRTPGGWRYQNDYQPYIPPTPPSYAPVLAFDFNDGGTGGWYKYNMFGDATEPYNVGGTLRQDMTASGLFASAEASSPYNQVLLPIGTPYRVRAAINFNRYAGSLPSTVTYKVGSEDSVLEATVGAGNYGWFEAVSPVAYTQYSYTQFNIIIGLSCGSLDANSLYTWNCDWVRLENPDGSPLMYETDPGDPGQPEIDAWPKWWDGSQWRR